MSREISSKREMTGFPVLESWAEEKMEGKEEKDSFGGLSLAVGEGGGLHKPPLGLEEPRMEEKTDVQCPHLR